MHRLLALAACLLWGAVFGVALNTDDCRIFATYAEGYAGVSVFCQISVLAGGLWIPLTPHRAFWFVWGGVFFSYALQFSNALNLLVVGAVSPRCTSPLARTYIIWGILLLALVSFQAGLIIKGTLDVAASGGLDENPMALSTTAADGYFGSGALLGELAARQRLRRHFGQRAHDLSSRGSLHSVHSGEPPSPASTPSPERPVALPPHLIVDEHDWLRYSRRVYFAEGGQVPVPHSDLGAPEEARGAGSYENTPLST